MENFKSKDIKVYDVIIEVEIDYTQSDEYRDKIKKLTYEYQNSFLEDQKRENFNNLLEYRDTMNKKEKVELTLYTEAYDHNVTLNGKITNKETAEITREFMRNDLMEQVTVTKEEVILKVDGVGVFKGENKSNIKEGIYNLKITDSKIEEKDSKVTGIAIIGDTRREIVEGLIRNIDENEKLFSDKLYKSLLNRPENPVSESYYKGVNRFKLCYDAAKKGYKDSRWVTFKQAQENKWKIKKGEKGTICEKWEFTKKVKEKDKNGKIVEYEEKLDKPFSSYFTLFNAEQIEGIPPQDEKEKKSLDEAIEQLKANSICPIIKSNKENFCQYNNKYDNILISDDIFFLNKEEYAETLIHEMCHATGSEKRSGRHKTTTILQEEIAVEIAVAFLKSDLGLDFRGNHINHTDYCSGEYGFKKLLETDYHDFFRLCSEAQKISDMVYKSYEGVNEKKNEIEVIKPPLENFTVLFTHSEYDFNIEPKTKLTGIEAYEFMQKIIELDNKTIDKYKTNISVGYGDELHKFNLILGNCEFSMAEKVSDALEYRLNFYKTKMEEYINKTGDTNILSKFNNQLKIDGRILENIKLDEKEYVLYKRKINKIKLENKPKIEKKPLRRRNSRSRSR